MYVPAVNWPGVLLGSLWVGCWPELSITTGGFQLTNILLKPMGMDREMSFGHVKNCGGTKSTAEKRLHEDYSDHLLSVPEIF